MLLHFTNAFEFSRIFLKTPKKVHHPSFISLFYLGSSTSLSYLNTEYISSNRTILYKPGIDRRITWDIRSTLEFNPNLTQRNTVGTSSMLECNPNLTQINAGETSSKFEFGQNLTKINAGEAISKRKFGPNLS